MAKATKQLGGAAKDKYFRELFAAAPGLPPVLARRLTELAKAEVSQVRIRQPLSDRARLLGTAADVLPEVAQRTPGEPASRNKAEAASRVSPVPAGAARPVDAEPSRQPAAPAKTFDPFAFTAVVVLKRQGAEALSKLLAGITDPAHLRQLADKQHLGVPADCTDAAVLRDAIMKSAQARIDDRRAAAS